MPDISSISAHLRPQRLAHTARGSSSENILSKFCLLAAKPFILTTDTLKIICGYVALPNNAKVCDARRAFIDLEKGNIAFDLAEPGEGNHAEMRKLVAKSAAETVTLAASIEPTLGAQSGFKIVIVFPSNASNEEIEESDILGRQDFAILKFACLILEAGYSIKDLSILHPNKKIKTMTVAEILFSDVPQPPSFD